MSSRNIFCFLLFAFLVFIYLTGFVFAEDSVKVASIYYHDVGPGTISLVTNPVTFDLEMEYLNESGFHTITYSQWYDYVSNDGILPSKPIILNFDDGYLSTLITVAPILQKYGFVGNVQIATNWIGTLGKVSNSNILTLKNTYGWEISSHSVSHTIFTTLTESQMISEFNDSREILKSLTGSYPTEFSFSSSVTNSSINSLCIQFYKICSHGNPGLKLVSRSDDLSDFNRYGLTGSLSFDDFKILANNFSSVPVSSVCTTSGNYNSTAYCDVSGSVLPLKEKWAACENDYECKIQSCMDGVCKNEYDSRSGNATGLLQNILTYLSGRECGPLNGLTEKCEGTVYFMCGANYVWENKGVVVGRCGVISCPYGQSLCSDGVCRISCGGSGGGGDSGGGGCWSVWNCTEWSDSENQCGTRTCVDRYKCFYVVNPKPAEVQDCENGGYEVICGNGNCDIGEDTSNCPADCAVTEVCGDGICGGTESSATCPSDCKSFFSTWKIVFLILWLILIAAIFILILYLIIKRKNSGAVQLEKKPQNGLSSV